MKESTKPPVTFPQEAVMSKNLFSGSEFLSSSDNHRYKDALQMIFAKCKLPQA